MAKTREKKAVISGDITLEQAEQHFGEYAKADAKVQKIKAAMDLEMTKIREKYQEEILDLEVIKTDAMERLYVFAQNKPELFTKKKSIEMTHGVLGFRTGTPALKTLKGFTWASVTEMLKEFLPDYVRKVEEADKAKLLLDRENEEVTAKFGKCGIKVEQTETFFLEPKKEE